MNDIQRNKTNMVSSVAKFAKDNAAILSAAATALVPQLTTAIDEVDTVATLQLTGSGEISAGVAQRRTIAKQLRLAMVDIGKVGRILDKTTQPGIAEHLHLPKSFSYPGLITTGEAFVEVLTPADVKADFVAAGLPATFLADLSAVIAKFRTATERKAGGLISRSQGSQGLTTKLRKAVAVVRALDAILTPQLRESDPVLHAGWKTALHIQRPPKKKEEAPAAPQQPLAAVMGGA
jgi:hypothetical protein